MNTPIPILVYHSIATESAPRFRTFTLPPSLFAAQMAHLNQARYTPITATQLARAMTDPSIRLAERTLLITFDDGLADFFTAALPVLRQYNFPATLYIATGFVGGTSRWLRYAGETNRPMLTWSQIAEISNNGVECGAHSHTHPYLDIIPPAQAQDEIMRPKMELEQHSGRAVETFSYPHGYHSAAVKQLVRQAGYSSACALKHATSALSDDRFALARIIVTPDTTLDQFSQLVKGSGLPIAPTRERTRTKVWRFVRRSTRWLNSRLEPDSE
jgi:peptidoglycan/xylan/chitin deacetylase (PgdA/CDA1 family)